MAVCLQGKLTDRKQDHMHVCQFLPLISFVTTNDATNTNNLAGAKGQMGTKGQKGHRGLIGLPGYEGITGPMFLTLRDLFLSSCFGFCICFAFVVYFRTVFQC